jgi:mRNA-degrading endonuclease toxin of MazEF toxin-antitoxin module
MPVECAVSLDNLRTVPQALLTESITRLDAERLDAICKALSRAAELLTSQRFVAEAIVNATMSS